MYGASQTTCERVYLAVDEFERGGDNASELYEKACLENHPFAEYSFYIYKREVGPQTEADAMFNKLLEARFPPAVVRQGVIELKQKKTLNNHPWLLSELKKITESGHLVAKKLVLTNKMLDGPVYLMPIRLIKIWQLGWQERILISDSSQTNECVWY